MGSFLQKLKKQTLPHCSVVVVAAGSARRMAGVDKIMAPIAGQPVIARTLTVFQTCSMVDEVVVVTRSDLIVPIGNLCKDAGLSKVTKIVAGGADRSHSVLNGLKEISNRAKLIAIHDGARPFVSQQVLESVIRMAAKTGAAAPAVPVTDTIKIAENGVVTATPDRETLFAVQTPQVFDADLIRGALHHCLEQELALTDDCSAVEQLGKLVSLTEGDTQNIKITTQFDLLIGEVIASCQSVT